MYNQKETTYYCENCHTKYNRSIQKAQCPFCQSEFVIEQPYTSFTIPKYEPSYNPSSNPYIQAPIRPYLNFNPYAQSDLVDMPNYQPFVPQRPAPYQRPFSGGLYGPSVTRPMINRDPMSEDVFMGQMPKRNGLMMNNHFDDDHFEDERFGTIRHNNGLQKCFVCDERLSDEVDIVTYTCGHQVHTKCVTSKHCDKCLSMFN